MYLILTNYPLSKDNSVLIPKILVSSTKVNRARCKPFAHIMVPHICNHTRWLSKVNKCWQREGDQWSRSKARGLVLRNNPLSRRACTVIVKSSSLYIIRLSFRVIRWVASLGREFFSELLTKDLTSSDCSYNHASHTTLILFVFI